MSTTTTTTLQPHHPLHGIATTLGPTVFTAVQKCSILLIGSGGIGCELLKNLALSGFRKVEVIDLDTIDVSNLNRQFLFRSQHVGMPKCTVATQAAMDMIDSDDVVLHNTTNDTTTSNGDKNNLPEVSYKAHHGNVKDNERFGVNFFKKFDVVLNALDNVDARRHVNRVCLAGGVPLVEAGTTGYLGQVTVIAKDSNIECYECQPKPTQKVYPICTIRSTPSMPVHTIVWAKELYKLIFHDKPELSMLYEDPDLNKDENVDAAATDGKDDGDNEEEEEEEGNGESVYMHICTDQRPTKGDESTPTSESSIKDFAKNVIEALFITEIDKQINMNRYKTAKVKPTPLDLILLQSVFNNNEEAPTKKPSYKHTDTWTPSQCIAELSACFLDAYSQNTPAPVMEFDKDDVLSMRFVTAASNLRAHIFGIDKLSLYDAKGVAGNIIPAIATTNAIVAGLQLLQIFKLLEIKVKNNNKGDEDEEITQQNTIKKQCRYTYCLRDKTRKGYYIQPTTLPDPNHKCFVCGTATVDVTIDVHTWVMQDFINKVLKKRLGFSEPSILLGDSQIHEEGEGADLDSYRVNLSKKLVDLPCGGVKDGTMIRVEDFSQDLEVDLCITHQSEWDEKEQPDGFIIGGAAPVAKAITTKEESKDKSDNNDDDDVCLVVEGADVKSKEESKDKPDSNDDDVCLVDEDMEAKTKKKRSFEETTQENCDNEDDAPPKNKRARKEEEKKVTGDEDHAIMIE